MPKGRSKKRPVKKRMYANAGAGPSRMLGVIKTGLDAGMKIAKIYKHVKSQTEPLSTVKHNKLSGGGNVICTHVNIGRTKKKDKIRLREYKSKGAYGTSQFQTPLLLLSAATDGISQVSANIGNAYTSSAITTLLSEAWDTNAAWAALKPGLTSSQFDGKILLNYCKIDLEFTNMQPTVTFVNIDYYTVKTDIATVNGPNDTWAQSLLGISGNNTNTLKYPDSDPNQSGPLFKGLYKRKNTLEFCMNAGEVRRITYYVHKNKVMNAADLQRVPIGSIKGLTDWIFWRARGCTVDNANTQFTAPTVYSLAPVKLVGKYQTEFSIAVLAKPSQVHYQQSSGFTGTIASNLYSMQDEDGDNVNIFTAPIG